MNGFFKIMEMNVKNLKTLKQFRKNGMKIKNKFQKKIRKKMMMMNLKNLLKMQDYNS